MKACFSTLFFFIILSFTTSYSQQYKWAKNIGSASNDYGRAVVVDQNGYVYITGHFSGTNVDFDPGPGTALISSMGGDDIFFAKYDSSGNYIWAKNIGGTQNDYSVRMLLDNANNIYIGGWFGSAQVDFDPGPGTYILSSEAEANICIGKYDSDGNFIWALKAGGPWAAGVHDLCFDNEGNIMVSGYYCGTNVNFNPKGNPILLSSQNNSGDIFFAKYDISGNCIFAKSCHGPAYEVANAVRVDPDNNIYICGPFMGTVDFNPGTGTARLTSAGDFDFFFAKYTSSGDYIWAKRTGGPGMDNGGGFLFTPDGNVMITSQFSETADFDPGTGTALLTAKGGADMCLAKYTSNGNYISAVSIGGTGDDSPSIPVMDADKNIYFCGAFDGQKVDFDPGGGKWFLSSKGGTDIFISKFDPAGKLLWAKSIGGSNFDYCSGLYADSKGYLYIIGEFGDTNVDFDPFKTSAPLSSNGGKDIFFGKYTQTLQNLYLGETFPDTIPRRFGTSDLISPGTWTWHGAPVFIPDGSELYVAKYNHSIDRMEMYEKDNINGTWSELFQPSFASDSSDTNPVIMPGGDQLMFTSRRSGQFKIYQVDRTDNGWGPVQALNFDYNSVPGSVISGFSAADDGTLYFTYGYEQNNLQIGKAHLVDGVYTMYETLPAPLNSEAAPTGPFIAPDQSYIIFISNMLGSLGLHDIYVSFHRTDGSWTTPLNMGNRINGNHEDVFPLLSPDGKYMFFASCKPGDDGYNAYWVSSDVIKKLNPLLSADEEVITPTGINLYQNYPNPFNPSTTIKYSLNREGQVRLKIYDVLGNLVSILVDEYKYAGEYSVKVNASSLSSGVYFYRLDTGTNSIVKKLLVLK